MVFCGDWSILVVGNHCQSLAVFHGRWQSFMVVNGLSKSSLKFLLLAPNLLNASRQRSFGVVGGRQRYFVLFPYDINEMTGSLVIFQGRSRSLR